MKKLTKAAKQKDCHDLSAWTKSICNHLWWSCQTCERNALTLKEKWISVLHHSCNEHTWGDSETFTSCAHPPLEPDKNDGIKWLSPESASHKALQSIVLDPHLIKIRSQKLIIPVTWKCITLSSSNIVRNEVTSLTTEWL